MSGTIQDALANAAGITIRRPRAIGTIIPHVVAEEENADETVVTDHPVERGAPVSDHAYMAPRMVQMKCAWSNSSQFATLGEGFIDQVYAELQALQNAREPFALVTGKRSYPSMLIQSLSVSTDVSSENALSVVARFREVIIVSTTTTTLPPRQQQAQPQRTEAPADRGGVALTTPTSAALDAARL